MGYKTAKINFCIRLNKEEMKNQTQGIIKPKNFKRKNPLKNSSGVAVVEMLPLLMVFIIFFGLTFGFWQSIHAGTLQSIAARHYAFEVINNRSNLFYGRDEKLTGSDPNSEINLPDDSYYKKNGYRYFSVVKSQPGTTPDPKVETKELNLFGGSPLNIEERRDDSSRAASPIWLKQAYGICLHLKCEEE